MKKTFGKKLYYIVSDAVKITGSFDPDKIMFYFEEQLTNKEYATVHAFLKWINKGEGFSRHFGSGNYEKRYSEFLNYVEL